jgi:extracellular elastinolytic metalloproteinase
MPKGSAVALSSLEMSRIAQSTMVKNLNLESSQLRIVSQSTDHMDVTHIYMNRVQDGIMVSNNNAAVHISKGEITSHSSNFKLTGSQLIRPIKNSDSIHDYVKGVETKLSAKRDSIEPYYSYIENSNGELIYCYNFQVRNDEDDKWMHVAIDVENGYIHLIPGEIVELINYYNEASYRAIKLPHVDPLIGGFSTLVNPENLGSSPSGWHSDGHTQWTNTQGNNADVFVGSTRGYRPDGGTALQFDSNWNPEENPTSPENKKASSTHLFTIVNIMHDLMYQFGFTESMGNFQNNNFNRATCKDCDKDRG